jgi:fascin 1/2
MASRILTMANIHSATGSKNTATTNNSSTASSKLTVNDSFKNSMASVSSTSSSSSTCSNGSISKFSLRDSGETIRNLNGSVASSGGGGNGNLSSTNSKWNLGLMNSEGKYLTAENFGFKINATGNTLRKKQKWLIEQDNDEIAYLISPLGCYLSTDKYGKLTCEKQSSDNDCKFYLEANGDGKWAFKSAVYGYYFGGTGDMLHCFSKAPEWWTVHLAIHPQVTFICLNDCIFSSLVSSKPSFSLASR